MNASLSRQLAGEFVGTALLLATVVGSGIMGEHLAGVIAAHWMFELPFVSASQHVRAGYSQMGSELVATFGLLTVILNCARYRPDAIAAAVGCYIAAAYWFTASTSFANPAVTIARSLTDSFSGIRPIDAPGFIVAQIIGALLAVVFYRWMTGSPDQSAPLENRRSA